MKTSCLAVVAAAAVLALAGGVASALSVGSEFGPNLVVNGGFETGDLTGWLQSGNTGFTGVSGSFPHSGSFALFEGPVGSLGFISQDIPTIPGAQYNIHLWFLPSGGIPNELRIDWGGVTVFDQINIPAGPYAEVLFDPVGPSVTTLTIGFQNDPGIDYIDDISVFQVQEGSVIPEPATLSLLGIGLTGLVRKLVRRRNR